MADTKGGKQSGKPKKNLGQQDVSPRNDQLGENAGEGRMMKNQSGGYKKK